MSPGDPPRPGAHGPTRAVTGRHRQEFPAAEARGDLTGPTPPPTMPKTPAEWAYLEGMLIEQLVAQEKRLIARVDTAIGAQHSAELTTLERKAKRARNTAITLGAALGAVMLTFSTAWQVWHDAKRSAVEPAQAAEAKTYELDEQVKDNAARLDALESAFGDIDRDLGTLSRKLDRLLEDADEPDRRRQR